MPPRIPSPVPGVDLYALPLSTLEAFVLSRVDGSASVEDISIMSGIAEDKLLALLARLAELGAVELSWASRAKARAPEPRVSVDAHFVRDPPRYAATELEEQVGISVGVRKRILHAHYALEGRDLYALLGVARDVDKKVIRNAYFELSKVFHPDAYFGKDLGSFKPKLEGVFKRLTEAYEVLGKVKKRAEYDEYLATTEQTQKVRQTLDSIQFTREELETMRRMTEQPAVAQVKVAARSAVPAPPRSPPAPMVEHVAPTSARPQPTSARPQPTNAERRARVRDRLRQRLGTISSQRPPSPSGPVSEPAIGSEQRRRTMIDGLRQSIRASAALSGTPQAQVQSHVKRAKDAEQAGDVLLAASQLQAALAIDPNNQELLAEYERVSKVVARNLSSNYEKQAVYEEKTGNWPAAARSWARVSDGRPEDANAARRTAEALLKTSSDLHRAQKYAQKAASLDAQSLPNLTLLARVYLAAGLKLNALRELEKAAQLAPHDEMVNNLLREAR
jgi:curved DNA-binding protein CbpA